MTDTDPARAPTPLLSLLELLGLSGLTVAQPLLATFGDSPDFFVFRQATRTDIVAFALAVAIVPALAVWLLTSASRLGSPRFAIAVHHGAIGAFAAVGVLQLTAAADLTLWMGVPLAVATAGALVQAVLRWPAGRSWLRWSAPAPLVFVAIFLVAAPVSDLVRGDSVDPAALGAFGSGDPPPVVVMVFDEWPLSSIVRTDGTIDEAVAPNVARLADGATWYRNTTTVANITNFAVPSILTGNMPQPGDRAEASAQPENLFTLLGGTYDLQVKESLTRLCPVSMCAVDGTASSPVERATRLGDLLEEAGNVLMDRLRPGSDGALVTDGFVEPEQAIGEAKSDDETFNLEELLVPRPERLGDFLAGMQKGEDPTVHYVHVLGPHTPHRHLPSGLRYPSDGALRLISPPDGSPGSDLRGDARWPARLDRQRLLLEVGYVDTLIGDVLDELDADGLFDDALIVLTSDHGIGFEPGASARGLGDGSVEREVEPDLLWVPLVVKAPGQTDGQVSDVDARTIDILPTIAGHLGIDLPWEVDGSDLNDLPPAGRGPKQFVRIEGSSFAVFKLDDPVDVRAELDEVFERGTDALLTGAGPDRWWRVGPRPDLVKAQVRDLQLGPVRAARYVLDDPTAIDDIDLSSGEAPLLLAGRILRDGEPRASSSPLAVLVDRVVAAVVPTYDDGDGPGRFSVLLDPELFDGTKGRVRIADVVERDGETVLALIPEA